jgi:hypothetical protein
MIVISFLSIGMAAANGCIMLEVYLRMLEYETVTQQIIVVVLIGITN